MEEINFKQTSMMVTFQRRTLEFDPVIPSKGIACALECSDDPKCLAYDFDQISKCALMTQINHGTTGTPQKVFGKVKGKNSCDNIYLNYIVKK